MEAPKLPNKIYFTTLDVGSGWVYSPSLEDNGGEQYIRKDALLEWAESKMKEYALKSFEKNDDGTHWGQRNAFQQVIDKIKSL